MMGGTLCLRRRRVVFILGSTGYGGQYLEW